MISNNIRFGSVLMLGPKYHLAPEVFFQIDHQYGGNRADASVYYAAVKVGDVFQLGAHVNDGRGRHLDAAKEVLRDAFGSDETALMGSYPEIGPELQERINTRAQELLPKV